jgi:hypothetical protein
MTTKTATTPKPAAAGKQSEGTPNRPVTQANGTKPAPKASPAKAQPKATVTKHSKCKRCGYAFRAAQVLDTCASAAACKGRQEIRKAEAAAGLDVTQFTAKDVRKQTVLARQRLAEAAKAA